MSRELKSLLLLTMTAAFFFGFLPLASPGGVSRHFERLHVFLFNLCSGGTLLLFYSGAARWKVRAFYLMSLSYALCAWLEIYLPAVLLSLALALLAESVRGRRFSWIPLDFFRGGTGLSLKFHHASLLCLSLALLFSGLVVVNEQTFQWVSSPKLVLDVFFLGFSFPMSLATMGLVFAFMRPGPPDLSRASGEASFWAVNLGVIVFFGFILAEALLCQVLISILLFASVLFIFRLFASRRPASQEGALLVSGMLFIILTGLTGAGYAFLKYLYGGAPYGGFGETLLLLHSYIALYGWNLCGMIVLIRMGEFPLRVPLRVIILLHWLIVLLLAPLGRYAFPFGLASTILYAVLLYILFFGKPAGGKNNPGITSSV